MITPLRALGDERPLRIATVTEFYYPHIGGICENVHFFAHEARRRGHHVDIITSRIDDTPPRPHVIQIGRSHPIAFNGATARFTLAPGLRRRVRDTLRRGRYDIVHVHSPLAPTLPLIAVDEAECPVVGTFHTYFARSLAFAVARGYFQRRLDRLAAAIAVSHAATMTLDRYFDAGEWIVIPNGVDTDFFSPDAPPPAGIDRSRPYILFLHRLEQRNGLETLIAAFRLVRARGHDVQLVVVGDGPSRPRCERLAAGDPDITFVGSVLETRPSFYANAALYACPTTIASFGITLLEAMACETPIVCSDILGFRDVVADGREALMYPCGDVVSLARCIERVLADPDLARRLGTTGRDRAVSEYAWPCVAESVLDVYRAVLGRVPALR